jgi:hypothetical protein
MIGIAGVMGLEDLSEFVRLGPHKRCHSGIEIITLPENKSRNCVLLKGSCLIIERRLDYKSKHLLQRLLFHQSATAETIKFLQDGFAAKRHCRQPTAGFRKPFLATDVA